MRYPLPLGTADHDTLNVVGWAVTGVTVTVGTRLVTGAGAGAGVGGLTTGGATGTVGGGAVDVTGVREVAGADDVVGAGAGGATINGFVLTVISFEFGESALAPSEPSALMVK